MFGADMQGEFHDSVFNPLAQLINLISDQTLNDGDELITGIARQKIVLAQLPFKNMRYLAHHLVADAMPVSVVDLLELVQVEHDDLERMIRAARACGLLLKAEIYAARVRQSRQRVCQRVRLRLG